MELTLKGIFIGLTTGSSIINIILSASWGHRIALTHQYCIASCFFLSFFLGTFCVNMIRVSLNVLLAPYYSLNCGIKVMMCRQAIEVYRDMKAVK